MLARKKIILAVCGSIAAYKVVLLVRLLIKRGAEVRVLMTHAAVEFVTPLTLSTLSKNKVFVDFVDRQSNQWVNHVKIGLWADLMVIAPLTANTLAKMANGLCDNVLLSTYFSARCPVVVAPSMDVDMYSHPTAKHNLEQIKNYGSKVIEPTKGELASGLNGVGRMAEPEYIVKYIENFFSKNPIFLNKKILITSGSTQEAIDPIRFISNRSTGKMGKALAECLQSNGAQITFIAAPSLVYPENVNIIHVQSATDMYDQALKYYHSCEIAIFVAAVSDFRPENVVEKKIKKSNNYTISLKLNPDIAAELGKLKKHQLNIGFALETDNPEKNALEKLRKKKLDLIVLNILSDTNTAFMEDTNKVSIFNRKGLILQTTTKPKTSIAKNIMEAISQLITK